MIDTKGSYLVDDYLEVADFWAWETDENLVLIYLSSGFTALTGLPVDEFLGRSRSQINKRDLDHDIWRKHHETLMRRRPFRRFRYPLEASSGEIRWFESSGIPHFDAEGRFVGYRGVARDVTEHVRDRARLTASNRETKLQQTLLAHIERVSRIGAWRWTYGEPHISMSDEIYRILGVTPGMPTTRDDATRSFAPRSRGAFDAAVTRAICEQVSFDLTLELDTPHRGRRWARVIGLPEVVDGRTTRLFGTFQDVTEQREQELEMRRLAMTDALTDTANRAAFNERLERVAARSAETGHGFMLCVADLNRFKQVNDQHGHDVGDKVLVRFAGQFKADMPENWFFARMGGDEFAVLIGDGEAAIDLDDETARLKAAIEREICVDAASVAVHATGGFAVAPADGTDTQALMRRADLALYDAKTDADCHLRRFEFVMEQCFERRVLVMQSFREALDLGQIVPHYQPVVELATGQATGMEALARWQHPERGVLTAAQFADVFDDARMSIDLSRVMLERVCEDMAAWDRAGGRFGRVGINVTAAVLEQPGFALRVIETLGRHRLRPENLVIEITETMVINSAAAAITEQLQNLLEAGVQIALDDFGTGFSSLTHLKSLPFNILKIDKTFVDDMLRSAADQAIVRSLIGLGRDLGYTTVAEGIEHWAEAQMLRRLGCERGQGYLFHKPMPRQDIERLLGIDADARPVAAAGGS